MLLLVLKARTWYGIDGHVTFTMSIDMSGNSLPGPVYMPCNPCATASAIHSDDQAHCLGFDLCGSTIMKWKLCQHMRLQALCTAHVY